ncbi:hypothetical protein DICPUDRAFT_46490 [Dictyostelium purpureum]|uniref:TLDc domain-containing protein n=1 Tax=Dictyostelium purpureum TaxID=5786 RepID=F0ZF06_DICPU|nr:uncharacterized protein DICPUDRAFT_46490 [Dictyostelium purpureum]EGC37435.1 hypothetical protein DICPUDRAFT_46490 [Dictyostelium purpureum]|eukprot:XP_003285999.1 hypothetical protein DICPUDRAFT_46490 [Dictyostelium purpureum]
MGSSQSKHHHHHHHHHHHDGNNAAQQSQIQPQPQPQPIFSQVKMPEINIKSELLKEEHIRLISKYLPDNTYRDTWKLLFSSPKDGHSFNRFCHHATDKGSVLILIREEGGHIFGGFCDEALKPKYPKFYGTKNNFVFTVEPKLEIFQTTGLDRNYQYLNQGSMTLFNGIGMGGIEDLFGWSIDGSFENGTSKGSPEILECGDGKARSSTYGNTCLASSPEFKVVHVEVYLLKSLELTEEQILEIEFNNRKKGKQSVLNDEGNSDKAIKSMMGHEFSVYNEDLNEDPNKIKDNKINFYP